ncbi:uncharacterized protein LOC126369541 [Pectinophora gossypiella]|uniref:uncharacterized protein LOC126369541 n=1 Tax=Pectinophora gossypiella TaxID=13191 RepID=UPI00214E807B|nr:uncharacterized protein LOC126369541 [Pectinophora gossypiella]
MHFQIILCFVAFFISVVQAKPIVMDLPGSIHNDCLNKRNAEIEGAVNKEIFKVPRILNVGNEIIVTGLMKDGHTVLTVNLMAANEEGKPDHFNVACQVRLDFPSDTSTKDMITFNTIVNGARKEVDEGMQATELFIDNNFTMKFTMNTKNRIGLNLKESAAIQDCESELGMEAIQYLTVGGDVHKVEQLSFVLG